MAKINRPRHGSLQFYPRSRASKIIPSANWKFIQEYAEKSDIKGVLGFLGYKVGMVSCLVKNNTKDSLTKNKQMIVPATIIEIPGIKVLSIRLIKDKMVKREIKAENIEKELKRKIKFPKKLEKPDLDKIKKEDYDDLRLVCYSLARKTFKKTPDIFEIGIGGNLEEKITKAKELLGKEIPVSEFFKKNMIVDSYGLTRGKGTQGPMKRFGTQKRPHKSEKGVRNPGSLGPWHPAKVRFSAPIAGQLGFFTRVQHNNKVIEIQEKNFENLNKPGFRSYGIIKNPYILIKGSLQGSKKRALLLTISPRPTKEITKQNFELLKVER
jgi:large subunit ribosomal protein L3